MCEENMKKSVWLGKAFFFFFHSMASGVPRLSPKRYKNKSFYIFIPYKLALGFQPSLGLQLQMSLCLKIYQVERFLQVEYVLMWLQHSWEIDSVSQPPLVPSASEEISPGICNLHETPCCCLHSSQFFMFQFMISKGL